MQAEWEVRDMSESEGSESELTGRPQPLDRGWEG